MTDGTSNIDATLRAEFIDEALDGLRAVSELLVRFEANPTDMDLVQSIFRPIHSMKGNSAYFGLMKVKTLSHEMETLLDLVRRSLLLVSPRVISALLQGTDALTSMLQRVRNSQPEVTDIAAFNAVLKDLVDTAGGGKASEESLWKQLLAAIDNPTAPELPAELGELATLVHDLAKITPACRRLSGGGERPTLASITADESLLRLDALLGAGAPLTDPAQVCSLLEESGKRITDPKGHALIQQALSDCTMLAGAIGLNDPLARDTLAEHVRQVAAFCAPAVLVAAGSGAPPAGPRATSAGAPDRVYKTMRVPEKSIDSFLWYVGNLVTIGDMYQYVYAQMMKSDGEREVVAELRRVNESFSSLSLSLQKSIMDIRKVPMNTIVQRVPRTIRDIAGASGKQIEVRISGGDIMVDKSLVDVLEAPLMHMARNSADHGIETMEARRKAGKEPGGLVEVIVIETPDHIVLEVSDDGHGLDYEALTRKAVALGIIPEGVPITEQEVVELLFVSGVSSAAAVSEVSGRGVGMDVVKRAIEGNGGKINVLSTAGKGSCFTVTLPKTVSTQILNGFVIGVGATRYVIPVEHIVRAVRLEADSLTTVNERGVCISDGSNFLRVIDLADTLGIEASRENDKGVVIVAETKSSRVALKVDRIEAIRQVVLKSIEGLPGADDLFKGGAIMGDGTVAMILDVDKLIGRR